jgi:hypothetical protein
VLTELSDEKARAIATRARAITLEQHTGSSRAREFEAELAAQMEILEQRLAKAG